MRSIFDDDIIDHEADNYWKCNRHGVEGNGDPWCFICKDEERELKVREKTSQKYAK